MNGLEFLEKIMRLRPTPVIMVSSLTNRGADADHQGLRARRGRLHRQALGRRPRGLRRARRQGEDRGRARACRIPRRSALRRPPRRRASGSAFLRFGWARPRHRLLDRRRRGADLHPHAVSGELPADGHHAAHAGDLHQELRRAARAPLRPAGRRRRSTARRCRSGGSISRPARPTISRSQAISAPALPPDARPTRSTAIGPRSTCCSTRSPRPRDRTRSA